MDILTSKLLRAYENLSRYQTVPFYYNTADNKYIYGIGSWLSTTTNYREHKVVAGDSFDSLALKYYGTPTYYWIIMDFNRIADPLLLLPIGTIVRIPTLTDIEFED